MNQADYIPVACVNGHSLRAPERSVGRTLPCPVCGEPVVVARPRASVSDTGVMRILGEFVPATASSVPAEFRMPADQPESRPCPVCSCAVSESASVCQACHCYVGKSPDYLRSLMRASSSPVRKE
ncbi:hypothetical protein Q31b_32480 [Novipirellula aureliae]|uniref:Uncharacterized protein n=1 Tax=Novipirellula aureliae TaxID=2527966 RepID=A0A5C6DTC5_9BACT|nr:hypothetical protein Q31b_32480 [Novipirellula aureliae]